MPNNLYVREPGKWTGTWYKVIQPIPCLVEAIGKDGDPTWGRLILRPGMHVIAMPEVFVCPDGKIAFPAEYDGNDPDYWPLARLQRCAPLPQKIDFREFGNGFMKEERMLSEGVTYVTGKEPEVRAIVRAAFPDYRGNRFKINVTDQPVNIASYWEGGSRDYYAIVRLDSLQVADVPQQSAYDRPLPSQFKDMRIPDGIAIVQHSIVRGQDRGITIHINPSNASKMLGSGQKDTLSRNERIVLTATRSLKSSYGGIKDYRYHEAARQTGITRPEWDAAKASLIKKRMLNSAGAITVDGRNAIGQTQFYNLKEETLHEVYPARPDSEKIHPKLHFYLVSAVTEYDKTQQGKPGFNRYALPQYLSTIEDIEDDIREGASVRSAIETYFSGRLLTFVLKWVAKLDKKLVEEIEPTLPKSFGQFIQK